MAGDVPVEIARESTASSTVEVSGLAGALRDVEVNLDITVDDAREIDAFLISPSGTRVELFSDVGGFDANFTNTTLDDEAMTSLTDAGAPFTGSFRPEHALRAFDGEEPNGTWTLEIAYNDVFPFTATLNAWSLSLLAGDDPSAGGDVGLPDWTIYIDQNRNGIFDGASTTINSTDSPETIVDDGLTMTEMTVEGLPGVIGDVNVQLDINHTNIEDLDVYLFSPSGTRIELFSDVGGEGVNFQETMLDDQADAAIIDADPPFTGRFRPEQSLMKLNDEDPNGTWTLLIDDDSMGNTGELNRWSLTVTSGEPSRQTDSRGTYGFKRPSCGHVRRGRGLASRVGAVISR